MKIHLHLHTTLQQESDSGMVRHLTVDLPARSTMAFLLNSVSIKIDLENTLLVVNHRTAGLNFVLSDGDQVHLIPAISGG